MKKLILASTSQPRKMLLERLQISFECAAPDVDETPLLNEKADKMVLRLAKEKAQAVRNKFPDALIIGADQVGVLDGMMLGKPLVYEQAVKQLRMMSGQRIEFFIGLCLLDAKNKSHQIALEKFTVVFRKLSMQMIENYLKKEHALNCAGSVTVEGLGIALLEKLEGEDYTALIGLPLIRLTKMLEEAGMQVI